jgi:hypothetical protein
MKLFRLATIVAAPLLLASCLLTPGKFTSSLDIRKDRSFTFVYQGEVLLLDPSEGIGKGLDNALGEAGEAAKGEKADKPDGVKAEDRSVPVRVTTSETPEVQRKAILEALSKEEGYRSVEYLGGNKFKVDYQVSGRLDRNFVYPLNIDAMAIIPWIAIELRKDGTARMMAIAFGDSNSMAGAAGSMKPSSGSPGREGIFTLTTDANLVMQNNEAGMAPGPGTRVVWKITPTTKAVPTAVVRF